MMSGVNERIILITGASSGIGKQCAKVLGKAGATVVLASRNEQQLQQLTTELTLAGIRAQYYVLDVTDVNRFREIVKRIVATYGRLDILINNAGIMLLSKVHEEKMEEWNRMIDVNFKGVLNGTAAVLPTMRKQTYGTIVNVASTAAYRVMANSAVYSATKFAVRAFSEGVRREESSHGIKVCLVAPGPTKTELLTHTTSSGLEALSNYVADYGLEATEVAKAIEYQLSVAAVASVDELILSPLSKMP